MPRDRLTPEQLQQRQQMEREKMRAIRQAQREEWERRKAEMTPGVREHYEKYEDGARALEEQLDRRWDEAQRAYHGGFLARLRYRFRGHEG
jgi:hypothetical protein